MSILWIIFIIWVVFAITCAVLAEKTEKVGIISGMEILKNTRPMQDIPFRTGVHSDKRKKREKVNKRNYDKWL